MKKLIAILTALMLTALMVPAMAEEGAALSPSTTTVKLSLNDEMVSQLAGSMVPEESLPMISAVINVINNLGITVVTDGVDTEAALTLKDQAVANFALLKDNETTTILSDLFPNTLVKVDPKALGLDASSVNVDPTALAETLAEPMTAILTEVQSKIGTPEAAEFEFEGKKFTVKTPVNMTTKELILLGLNVVKTVFDNEQFQQMLASLKENPMVGGMMPELDVDKMIEEYSAKSDDELPVMDAAAYASLDGSTVMNFNFTQDEQTMVLNIATIGTEQIIDMDLVMAKVYIKISDESVTMKVAGDAGGMQIGLDLDAAKTESGMEAVIAVSMSDMELLKINAVQVAGGELSGAFTLEGKTEVVIDSSVMSGDMSENEGMTALMQDLMTNGLGQLMQSAMAAMPEEFQAIMGAMGGGASAEEAPAEAAE